MELWNRNKVWICGSLALAALIFLLNKTGIYAKPIAATAYAGIVFLVLTLIPNNLLKLQFPALKGAIMFLANLVKYRRDFGIIAGFMFLAHALLVLVIAGAISLTDLGNINWTMISMIVFSKPIILGFISLVILILMLITSNNPVHRALGKNWKLLHSLVWLTVPFALAHSTLAKGSVDIPALIGFGAIMLFVLIEFMVYLKRPPIMPGSYKRHVFFTVLGIVIVIAVWMWMK